MRLQNCIKTFLQLFVSLCTDLLCSTELVKVFLSCRFFTRKRGHCVAGCPDQVSRVFTSRDLVGITFLKFFKFLLQMLYCDSFHKQVGVVKLL